MDKKSVRKEKNHKKKPQAVSAVGSYWRWLFVGGITVLAFSVGAASALLMAATPLKNGKDAFHLFPNRNGLSSIIPATLTKPVNILILGIDNSGHPHQGKITPSEALAGNSDTMLLVRLVPNTHHINILSIPRDMLTGIHFCITKFLNLLWDGPDSPSQSCNLRARQLSID